MNKPLLSAQQLAKKIGASPATILAWYHAGKIPAEVAEESVFRFDEEAVNQALEVRMEKLKRLYQEREELIASGTKLWRLPNTTKFRERMDAEHAAERARETKAALAAKGYELSPAPVKWMRQPWGRYS